MKRKKRDVGKRILSIIKTLTRPFRRFRIYEIYCSDETVSTYEDPHCPWDWLGSGCYDIEVYTLNIRAYLVTARDKDEAAAIRQKFLDTELEDSIAYRKKRRPDLKGTWWVNDIMDDIGYNAEPVLIRRSVKPIYKEDDKKEVLMDFYEENVISSENEKDLKMFQPIDYINSFRKEMADWKRERAEAHQKETIKPKHYGKYLLNLIPSIR